MSESDVATGFSGNSAQEEEDNSAKILLLLLTAVLLIGFGIYLASQKKTDEMQTLQQGKSLTKMLLEAQTPPEESKSEVK